MNTLIIGIAGGSGSGKTTLTNRLAAEFGDELMVISHDSYYRAHDDMSYEERCRLNYDHPDAYETELLIAHLDALRRGEGVDCPNYSFKIHNRTEETTRIEPSRVILLEGILILADEALRERMDIKVFVDADADIRVLRRIRRDIRDRARTLESVSEQYQKTVKLMHDRFVEPSKKEADLIVPSGGKNPVVLGLLSSRIREFLREAETV